MPTDPGGWTTDPGIIAQRVQQSFGQFFNNIGAIFAVIGQFLGQFFGDIGEIADDLQNMHDEFTAAIKNFEREIEELKNFKMDVKWKTRVIHVPTAITQLQDLKTLIFTTLKEKIQIIADEIKEFVVIVKDETSRYTQDPLGDKPSGLTRASVTIHSIITEFAIVKNLMKDVLDLSSMFLEITHRIETLEDLFLKQGNPRQRVKETATIRVGSLHR